MSHSTDSKNIYTVTQAAKVLDRSPRQVQRMCVEGRLKGAYQLDPTNVRSHWRIPKSALDTILRLREAQAER